VLNAASLTHSPLDYATGSHTLNRTRKRHFEAKPTQTSQVRSLDVSLKQPKSKLELGKLAQSGGIAPPALSQSPAPLLFLSPWPDLVCGKLFPSPNRR